MLKTLMRAFLWFLSIFVFIWLIYVLKNHSDCPLPMYITYYPNEPNQLQAPAPKRVYSYNRQTPLLFVTGIPGSGLELMRLILDRNPLIRCTQDTEIISNLIQRRHEWVGSKIERERLHHAGMTDELIDDSVSAFILELLLKQDKIADYLCNKDSGVFSYARYVNKMLPNVKFILMVRDPRGTVDSLIRKRIYYTGVNLNNNFEEGLVGWNNLMTGYLNDCKYLGKNLCKVVFYEKLVLDTNRTMLELEKFLNLSNLNRNFYKNLTNFNAQPILLNKNYLFKWYRRMSSSLWDRIENMVPLMKDLKYNFIEKIPLYSIYDNLTFF